jgi:hypothetical protein
MDAAERHQGHRDADQGSGHQQHQDDAAPPRRLMHGNRLGRGFGMGLGGHIKRHGLALFADSLSA